MRFSHEGLTLWYGTDDAPAPQDVGVPRDAVTITIGVQPPSPSNTVEVLYRVDQGLVHTLRAVLIHTDHAYDKQYFRATFPHFWTGNQVTYLPILFCAGRQVPDAVAAHSLPSSFRLEIPSAPRDVLAVHQESPTPPAPRQGSFPLNLEYLCTVTAQLNTHPEIIGVTPEGLKVDWFITGGTVSGPKLNARIRPEGGDWMTIRTDGIGILGIRSTFETHDGALIYMTTSGVFDLGEDGYHNFLNKKWPSAPAVRPVPRFITAHPRYQWLNRLQGFGVGEVHMADLLVVYDLYTAQ